MTFREIYGSSSLKEALIGMVDSGRIPHALLLHENDGGGAVPLALTFIQYLYCSDRHNGEPCGRCPACNKTSKLIHPDVHFVYPVTTGSRSTSDKPASSTYVRYWRETVLGNPYFFENELYAAFGIEGKSGAIAVAEAKLILETLSLSGVEGSWRTVLIYLPERMNPAAANTLLKMVEEPPEQTLFIMVTHEPEKVLRTVSSRCLLLRIPPLPKAEQAKVHPQIGADEVEFMDLMSDLLGALWEGNLASALDCGEAAAALPSRESQKAFCKFAAGCLRSIFLLQQGLEGLADIPPGDMEFYARAAERLEPSFPRAALQLLDRAVLMLERNVSQKILFCDLAGRMYALTAAARAKGQAQQ